MTIRTIVKVLENEGWVIMRQKGSHIIMKKNGVMVPIPNHKGDIKKGTLASIQRITGIRF